jgi:hypothetical protein
METLELDSQALMEQMAPALGLKIAPEYRPGVQTFLGIATQMAERVMSFELPDELEPAPIFRP